MINKEIVPNLSQGKRGPQCNVGLWRIVRAILKKLKTGCQWRELPMKELFGRCKISWNTVYYYFNKWSKDGSWALVWQKLLGRYRAILDMSSIELDGSHTPAKNGGQAVGYQHRKKCKTVNMLFLTDKQGIPLACSLPMSGNHHDIYEIEKSMQEIVRTMEGVGLSYEGLFMNADAGFDAKKLFAICFELGILANVDPNPRNGSSDSQEDFVFDSELYKDRFAVERTNAWIDSYKTLLVRFERLTETWTAFHYMAFIMILLKKTNSNGFCRF